MLTDALSDLIRAVGDDSPAEHKAIFHLWSALDDIAKYDDVAGQLARQAMVGAATALSEVAAMKASALRYKVRVWCNENGATGEYEFKAPSRIDATERAVEAFQRSCAMDGYHPPRHRCQTEVIGVGR